MTELSTPSLVIDSLDGTAAFAKLTGKAASTVSTWRKRGFPNDVGLYLTINARLKPKGLKAPASLFGMTNTEAA